MALTRLRANLFFLVHTLLVLFVYCSPFLAPWSVILGLIGIYYLQLFLVGHCVLTMIEFGSLRPQSSFHHYYLTKLGVRITQERLSFVLDYVVPWCVLATSLVWQVILNHTPLLCS